ncbi:ATPase [Novosphingobium sp. 9]|uniref:ATPase n=1 Tax=Novosphingobium sp. 9 TaxID=2025349 RepID=UPI0021B50D7B|nr:ATPase [Novosphingobium sp. 9]
MEYHPHAEDEADQSPSQGSRLWIAPAVAGGALLGWTAFFLFANSKTLTGASSTQVSALVSQWAMPAAFIAVLLLLVLRSSTREARRFGDAASRLSQESLLLEQRLTSVNRELSLAREFLASQSRDLETLGRLASERLSTNAARLEELVRENGERVETISTVSTRARDNMEQLRDQLPVIANAAKDVTNNIAGAGRMAHGQLDDMIRGFNRLNEFGIASERQVEALNRTTQGTLAMFAERLEQMRVLADERFAAMTQNGEALRSQWDTQERETLAAMRHRITALGTEIDEARQQLDTQEAQSLTSLRSRLGALRDESDVVSRAFRDSEQRALLALRSTLAGVEEEQQRRSAEIEHHQNAATSALSKRLGDIAEEIARLNGSLTRDAEQFHSEIEQRRKLALQHETEGAARLSGLLADIDAGVSARLAGHREHTDALKQRSNDLSDLLGSHDQRLASIVQQAEIAEARLARTLDLLAERLAAARETLASADGDVSGLTDAALRLLELVQASGKQVHDSLPEALSINEDRLTRLDHGVSGLLDLLRHSADNGERLADSVGNSQSQLGALNTALLQSQAALSTSGKAHASLLDGLRLTLVELEEATDRTADKAQGALHDAVHTLATSAGEAVASIETDTAARVLALAARLGEESDKAIDKAMRAKVAEISGRLEQAVAHASGVTHEATGQLRDELARVDELVGNLEARVTDARTRAEEQVDNNFARRAAIISESLNSHAIDIAGALSVDVSDTAWASYLRGDRGIFTRRAVSLLDAGQVKAIQQTYERDDAFRDHVNRYIHDFESILRQILSTRDGKALGVTLLSSDMGKLYVALAQGIERLRG